MSHPPLQLLGEWAGLLMESFAAAGVRDVVISPGSRSTPFVLAASRTPGLRLHDVIDERSAAFFALGQAKTTGQPTLLLCTSGSAGAHYLPALVEAAQAFVPLLVLTADRPFDLQDCGAPQTIDQVKLFGHHVRRFVELGAPEGSPEGLRSLRRRAAQAVFESTWPTPGPVHVNARAGKPLEAIPARTDEERAIAARARAIAAQPITRALPPRPQPTPEAVEVLAEACAKAERGLIVCGPAPLSQAQARKEILALAARTGFPILGDATSQLRFGVLPSEGATVLDASAHLLRSPCFRREKPDLVLQLGSPPTTSAWEGYLDEHAQVPRFVVAPHGWPDPQGNAAGMVLADIGETARALAQRLPQGRSTEWAAHLARANDAAWRAIAQTLEHEKALAEAEVARRVANALPSGAVLAVGNSLPIRLLDGYCPASSTDCGVFSQRGANGIDGLVSGAAGIASTGRPTVLLVGDVSFLHDLGGLTVARGVEETLVLVVIQNGGGRIFEQLPIAQRAGESDLRHFTTPHGITFGAAAQLFGVPYRCVDTRAALDEALSQALAHKGCSIVEAVVPANGAVLVEREVARQVDAALAQEWDGARSCR